MKFKINDKVRLNAEGRSTFRPLCAICKPLSYGRVIAIYEGIDSILRLRFYNAKNKPLKNWNYISVYAKHCDLIKPKKAYNHPLTPIFAKKMPHFGPKKMSKKRLDRKIFK